MVNVMRGQGKSANIAANNKLNNICAIIDWNKSASQLMPLENLKKMASFWLASIINEWSFSKII